MKTELEEERRKTDELVVLQFSENHCIPVYFTYFESIIEVLAEQAIV